MSDDVADVSMPEGIEVDDAAAYFGVFESSDALHQMMDICFRILKKEGLDI